MVGQTHYRVSAETILGMPRPATADVNKDLPQFCRAQKLSICIISVYIYQCYKQIYQCYKQIYQCYKHARKVYRRTFRQAIAKQATERLNDLDDLYYHKRTKLLWNRIKSIQKSGNLDTHGHITIGKLEEFFTKIFAAVEEISELMIFICKRR